MVKKDENKYLFDEHCTKQILRAHVERNLGGVWSFKWWKDDRGKLFIELVQELREDVDELC